MRRKRLMRIHLAGDLPSIEGLVSSTRIVRDGHYVVEIASVIEGEDRSFKLEGDRVLVPRERVVFLQELMGVAAR